MDAELKAAIRREALDTWRTLLRCGAVMLLAYGIAEGLKLWARG